MATYNFRFHLQLHFTNFERVIKAAKTERGGRRCIRKSDFGLKSFQKEYGLFKTLTNLNFITLVQVLFYEYLNRNNPIVQNLEQ